MKRDPARTAGRIDRLARAGLVTLALCGGVATEGSSSQAPPPVFSSNIEVVRLDVIVLDAEGRPVTGLAASDFSVEEDGQPQVITSFEPVLVRAPAVADTRSHPPRVTANRLRAPEDGRCVFLFFNDVNVTPVTAEYVRAALRRYLDEHVREGDWVTLMAPEQQIWWTARNGWEYRQLRTVVEGIRGQYVRDPLSRGISDWQAVCEDEYGEGHPMCQLGKSAKATARERAEAFEPAKPGGGIQAPASLIGGAQGNSTLAVQETLEFAKRRVSITIAGLRQALDSLAPLKGHKSVVMISEGFLLQPRMRGYKELMDAARRANVAVHFLDPRGLETGWSAENQDPEGMGQMTRQDLDSAGASDLSGATGGHRFSSNNDLVAPLRRVAAESEAYYLLGYAPQVPRLGERKPRVRVKRDGLTVRARNRYFVERAETLVRAEQKAKERDALTGFSPRSVAAMRSLSDATDLQLRAATLFFDANPKGEVATLLAVEVRPEDGRSGPHEFKVATEARRAEGGRPIHDRFEEKLELARGARAMLARQWRLPAGVWQVRVLVEDVESGQVGTAVHTFQVPEPGALRLSTPLVTSVLDGGEGARRPRLSLDRNFARADTVYCQFGVHGASRGSNGQPRVTARWELHHAGTFVRASRATPIEPTPDGRLVRMVGVSLEGLEPGEYELVVVVEDEQAHATTSRSEAFRVTS